MQISLSSSLLSSFFVVIVERRQKRRRKRSLFLCFFRRLFRRLSSIERAHIYIDKRSRDDKLLAYTRSFSNSLGKELLLEPNGIYANI